MAKLFGGVANGVVLEALLASDNVAVLKLISYNSTHFAMAYAILCNLSDSNIVTKSMGDMEFYILPDCQVYFEC